MSRRRLLKLTMSGLISLAGAGGFVGGWVGAYIGASVNHGTTEMVRKEEAQIRKQGEEIQSLNKKISQSKQNQSTQIKELLSKAFEALGPFCIGNIKHKNKSYMSYQYCRADGEVCDKPAREKCNEEYPSYSF